MRIKCLFGFLIGLFTLLIIAGCSNNDSVSENCNDINCNAVLDIKHSINIEKLEIYHFHKTNQCYSCKTVGAYAEETINIYFKDELDKGIIIFDHINIDLLENKDLAVKYGATGSSLWIGTYKNKQFNAEQNTNVWYKIKNKEDYMIYLKNIIEQKLAGN